MLIESKKQAATTTTSGGDQVKLTPIDQSQMIQINQIMDEMHHSIKDNNAGSGSTTSNGGVQQIMLNGQPALFIPASAFGGSNPMIQMNQEKQSNESISMSLDFSALLGNENQLNTSGKEDTVKYEPIDYEDEVMSQEEQVVGNQLCNLTNIINNNTSQQSAGHQNQGVTLYQLPNGTLTTDPHAAMMAADTSAQSQQPQYLYLPLPFDGNMSTQTVMQNTQQAFMTSNGQIMNQVVSQPAATVPKDDQNEYLLSGKKKTPRTGNTIAMALSKTNPVEESAKKRNCNKKKKFVDMVVDFKMNKLSTIISQNEKQQQQQISMTVPVQTAPIVLPAPPPQPPTQPQFQLLPGQQVFFDQQSNQWYIMNGPVYGGDKPTDQSTSPKEKSKLRDKEKSMGESDDDYEDVDDDFDDDDFSDNENNTNRKEGFHGRRRKACDCANCLKFKQHPGKEPGKKRTHVCHKCPKEYNKTSHLRAHLRAHDGLRPYACDFRSCGKMFTRSDELKRHKRIHTDERKFACAVCKKKFLRSDHLSKHMLIHIRHSKDLPQEVLATLQKTPNPADKRKHPNAQAKIKTLLLADEETKKNSQQHQQTHDSATPTAITLPNGTTAFISAMSALNSTIFP